MPYPAMLALPAAVVAGAVALGIAAHPPAEGTDRVQLEVAGLLPMPGEDASILVLREKGAQTLLPLLVPGGDAVSRADADGGALLRQVIEALGGAVSEVEIDRAEETRAGARVRLTQGGRRLEVRARPSESVALADAAGVPILTTRRLLQEAGVTPDELARSHPKSSPEELRL